MLKTLLRGLSVKTAGAVLQEPVKPTRRKSTKPKRPTPRTDRPEAIPNFAAYLKLAGELDIAPLKTGRVLQRAVADFLWENDIDMYAYNDVVSYMSAMAKKEKAIFCWRPLREADVPSGGMYGSWGWGNEKKHDFYWSKVWDCRPYDQAVPYDVLRNVKLLNDKFPGKLHFFVTDNAGLDPFIMATARDMGRIVFGMWDEPGFGTHALKRNLWGKKKVDRQ
jgi:hypothetical protein